MEVAVFYRQQILMIELLSKERLSEKPKNTLEIKVFVNFIIELLNGSRTIYF